MYQKYTKKFVSFMVHFLFYYVKIIKLELLNIKNSTKLI